MPYSLIVYSTPPDTRVVLTPDFNNVGSVGVPYTHPDGRHGQVCYLPDDAPDQTGAWLDVTREGYTDQRMRGFLKLEPSTMIARLQVDDYYLVELPAQPVDPTDPVQPSNRSPEEIINDVYNTTHPDLASHEGCGKFTEDCCDRLHAEHSQKWGHIGKNPGQNQYNGHAVDAVMLIADAKETAGGVYDIIQNSVSLDAKAVFNYVGPSDPNLWYYPAELAAAVYSYKSFALRERRR